MEINAAGHSEVGAGGGLPLGQLDAKTLEFDSKTRGKTGLRIKYEAEAKVIERRIGSLEAIRQQLGLSSRKMAQLLLVDPSAWHRWTAPGGAAPPHVWRALAWYLASQSQNPGMDAAFWLRDVSRLADSSHLQERIEKQESEIAALKGALQAMAQSSRSLQPERGSEEADNRVLATVIKWAAVFAMGALVGKVLLS